ncbi:MAG: hypothetical protein AMXMBFR7_24560 [Planctomycetota bacterium]
MHHRIGALMLPAVLFCAAASAREAPGIAVGAAAPALQGKTWFSKDGQAPVLTGKVHLVDFWFAR